MQDCEKFVLIVYVIYIYISLYDDPIYYHLREDFSGLKDKIHIIGKYV